MEPVFGLDLLTTGHDIARFYDFNILPMHKLKVVTS